MPNILKKLVWYFPTKKMPNVSEYWALTFNAGTDDVPDIRKVFKKQDDWKIKENRTQVTCQLCQYVQEEETRRRYYNNLKLAKRNTKYGLAIFLVVLPRH